MDNILNTIKIKMDELEKAHGIRILFACESGSRAWGFPSIDSDYDVRFIYARSKEWYLSIDEKRDVVELPVDNILDISGWDLKKALKLLFKHNSALIEWIQSPIVYAKYPNFIDGFAEVSKAYFSPMASMHHYLSCARKCYEECVAEDMVKLKAYFYCLRSTLAAYWILKTQTIPPMTLQGLLSLIENNAPLTGEIQRLIAIKAPNNESYRHRRESKIDRFLKETIVQCESVRSLRQSSLSDYEIMNAFFRTMIE